MKMDRACDDFNLMQASTEDQKLRVPKKALDKDEEQ